MTSAPEGDGSRAGERGKPRPDGPAREGTWAAIATTVAGQFGLDTLRSPTLKSVIERGVRYLAIDDATREIRFDSRALMMGFLIVGEVDRSAIRYGNTATWLHEWLMTKRPWARSTELAKAVTIRSINAALNRGYPVVLSSSVGRLPGLAQGVSERTVGRIAYEARHLLFSMVNTGVVADQARELLGLDLGPGDLVDLKYSILNRILETAEAGETAARWARDVSFPLEVSEVDFSLADPRPADQVTGFASDATDPSGDVLGTAADARALARLMCLGNAAPLAIAVLGGWGSGKSTFMERLDQEVKAVAASAGEGREARAAGGAWFVKRVVQIRFNAWQFVDANLWTSLTAEFFDQLRAGGWDRAGGVRHAGLVERVNRHVHALSAELGEMRRAISVSGEEVMTAQRARDAAATAAQNAAGKTLRQAAVDLLGDLYEDQKANLQVLGLGEGSKPHAAAKAIVQVVGAGRSIPDQLKAVVIVLTSAPGRSKAFLTVTGLALLIAGLAAWGAVSRPGWMVATVTSGVSAFTAVGAFALFITPAIKLVARVARRAGGIATAVKASEQTTLAALLASELTLREATHEAEALEAAADRADARLSRYVDPDAASNPPRLLRYVLEDDPNTQALAAEVGMIGRTRRLFQAVDDIVRQENANHAAEGSDSDVPQRIVLYIDDLDRCTEEQVYEVLQAIHLLLAFELFVVVVGVDIDWIHAALSKKLGEVGHGTADEDESAGRQRTSRYLEKIFQVAFWLSPLTGRGSDPGRYARYVEALAGVGGGTAPALESADPIVEDEAAGAGFEDRPSDGGSVAGSAPAADETVGTVEEELAETAGGPTEARALATIRLDPAEVAFLASPEIAALAAGTPRAVKRLINVYRLVRTRLDETGLSALGNQTQPPAYPIIALVVAIEVGQPVAVADAFYDATAGLLPSDGFFQVLQPGVSVGDVEGPASRFLSAFTLSPALRPAVGAMIQLRNGQVTAFDVQRVARLARRYSFNTYR